MIKTMKLYVFWSLIYMPLELAVYFKAGVNIWFLIFHYFQVLFISGHGVTPYPLWYLMSTVYALLVVISLLKRKVSPYIIAVVGALIASVGLYLDTNQSVFYVLFRGCLMPRGMFFIPVGMLLAHRTFNKWFCLLLAVPCFAFANIVSFSVVQSIFIAVCAICLFIFVSQLHLKDSRAFIVLRKLSTCVYFIHIYVWVVYYTLVYGGRTLSLDCFIVTSIVSLLLGLAWVFIKGGITHERSRVQ